MAPIASQGVFVMLRYVFAVAAGLSLLGPAAAADAKKLVLRWHGQSFFELETSKGTRIVFDPHAIEEYGRIEVKADLILISHLHNDHTQVQVVSNRDKAKTIFGVKAGRRAEWNLIDEQFRDVHVSTVGTYHDNSQGMERGKNAVFIVEADGLRLVFLGDLGHRLTANQIKQIGKVDVLLIPVGGVYTLNGSEAKDVVAQLKPRKYIVPMHYGTRVFEDVLPVDEFLDEQKNVRRFSGNRLEIETDFAPKEPMIAVLNYK
jgi:L-ascorbate metabolism protein UlaG (beta-lactamase superfamily)